VLDNGLFEESREGTPQGGPLSPLLSNLVLDELDRELEHRGHRFVRYADDCNIYVLSEKVGRRVMESLTRTVPQAADQCGEECRGPTVAPVVPRR
jgi:RNA-directed DNA polymerase